MSDAIPEGVPNDEWKHAELDAFAEREGIGPLFGTKAEKLEEVLAALEPAPEEPADHWADSALTIPVGAAGPTVARYRERLGLEDGSDQYDARMRSRVRTFQRDAGVPETGRLDPATRRLLT